MFNAIAISRSPLSNTDRLLLNNTDRSPPGIVCFGLAAVLLWVCSGCGRSDPAAVYEPASADKRQARRAFDGAPPVIPHAPLSGTCTSCHTPEGGRLVTDIGTAPANPHTQTVGMSTGSRCCQCHVFQQSHEEFVSSEFIGFLRDDVHGEKAHATAPPTIPHPLFMREDCHACHTGAAARPEIICRHATRDRCVQCHVQQYVTPAFVSPAL